MERLAAASEQGAALRISADWSLWPQWSRLILLIPLTFYRLGPPRKLAVNEEPRLLAEEANGTLLRRCAAETWANGGSHLC